MKHSGRVSGLSLSKELSSLAEFRLYTAEKLQLLEKLVSGINGSMAGPEASSKMDPTKRYGADHDPGITRACLHLLVASRCPLTIGQICAELESISNLTDLCRAKNSEYTKGTSRKRLDGTPPDARARVGVCDEPLSLVSKSLHQLANLTLAVPVERGGIRKWAWTGSHTVAGGDTTY
jgi:hypothetical protein